MSDREAPSGERVFAAPWEAQAFAMAVALHERGVFTWKEWAATLADVIAEVRNRGEPDTGEDYYRHWMTAPWLSWARALNSPKESAPADFPPQRAIEWFRR